MGACMEETQFGHGEQCRLRWGGRCQGRSLVSRCQDANGVYVDRCVCPFGAHHQGNSYPSRCQNLPVSSMVFLLTMFAHSFLAASSGNTVSGGILAVGSRLVFTKPGCSSMTVTPFS